MKWITRENAAVDRIACPWLIRRFVDPDAVFLFVPADQVAERARAEQATPFDVDGVELGHVDGRCSFESIVRVHGLESDRALARVADLDEQELLPAAEDPERLLEAVRDGEVAQNRDQPAVAEYPSE